MAITQVEIRTEEHTGTVLCVEGLRHGMFGFPIASGRVAVV